ncbi:MAG: hypothetical protein Fur0032_20790 [Terrimicrobiaceae bacterium]
MIHYFPTAGDGSGWAIDEDLRLIRASLQGIAVETGLARADVVHSPFWTALSMHDPGILARRFVIAHADNPPFFYLTQPAFAHAQQAVDLWVARSREAAAQFAKLGLPAIHIPYAIDGSLFFPIPEKKALRESLGLPRDRYLIGNFHRDSEGADLTRPKLQKAPEFMVRVCARLIREGLPIHVVLAGPRRHWIRKALSGEGIPFTFVGDDSIEGDDFGPNILPREKLNELTNACDLYFIPSRWEGGPQSAMEAAACRIKVLSPPLGVAADILEPDSLFDGVEDAVYRIREDIKNGTLNRTIDPQFKKWKTSHSAESMSSAIRSLYLDLPDRISSKSLKRPARDLFDEAVWQFRRRLPAATQASRSPSIQHEDGLRPSLDEVVRLHGITRSSGSAPLAGFVPNPDRWAGQFRHQLAGTDFLPQDAIPGAIILFPAVQDAVNYRTAGGKNLILVLPPPVPDFHEYSDAPLVIGNEDRQASLEILKAMACGRPVLHPDTLDYWYLVFHAGLRYGNMRNLPDAVAMASATLQDIRSCSRHPGGSLESFLQPFP